MTTMRSLAIIALLIDGTSPALAQNAPPTDGYPPPAAGAAGNPATYGPPGPGSRLLTHFAGRKSLL